MAERNLEDLVQDIMTCSICVEEAIDPRPLTCQHTYCLQCLKKYIATKETQDSVECPVCRQLCQFPNGNVEDLPASFLYSQLKDAKTRCKSESKKETTAKNKSDTDHADGFSQDGTTQGETFKTDMTCCSGGCVKTAESFCKTCKYICSDCKDDHQTIRALKGHVFLTLEEAANLQKTELPLCSKHPEERLKLFCEECGLSICSICFPMEHATHKCVDIIIKAAAEKDQLRHVKKTIKEYLSKSLALSESLTLHSTNLRETADNLKCKVRDTVDKIICEVKHREAAIIQDVDQNYDGAKKILKGEADKVNLDQSFLQNLQYSSVELLQHGSPFDLVTKRRSIEQTVHQHNPDDVELNLQEMDTKEAERKLAELKVGII